MKQTYAKFRKAKKNKGDAYFINKLVFLKVNGFLSKIIIKKNKLEMKKKPER